MEVLIIQVASGIIECIPKRKSLVVIHCITELNVLLESLSPW